ncbi:MAG: zinc ribbon domain-containing protein [Aquabacterium sp.]|nr:MAG: zinc ribbon domain-containing protein [Aquabacterium sp.]
MPIYAYRCEACGHAKDVLQKMSDVPLSICPSCGADAFRKQVTAAGFQLKGSGWYVTDFRGGSSAGAAAAAPAAGGSDGGTGGSGSDGGSGGAGTPSGGSGSDSGGSSGGGSTSASAGGGCGGPCACH